MTGQGGLRRVVTGLNEVGESCITIDGAIREFDNHGGGFVWRTSAVPADNSSREDIAVDRFGYDLFHDGGTNFFIVEMAPGESSSVHATDTTDYIVVIEGEIVLVLETEEVTLRAGDFFIDRGVIHSWRNDAAGKCVYSVVTIPAGPVGKGRTV